MADIPEVARAALALEPAQRAALAEELILSLDAASELDQAAVSDAWATEIERRVEEIRAGSVTMLTWDEVEARIDARLADRQL